MSWVNQSKWKTAEPDPMSDYSDDIITHMNEDHADALLLYCKTMSKATDASDAVMTHIDRYGFEMMATVDSEQKPIRLAFESDVTDSDEARIELVRMVKKARKMMSN